MGFAVTYRSVDAVTPAKFHEINQAADKLTEGRTWLSCEPLLLMHLPEDAHLYGSSKPAFEPHPDDVASAEQEGLPDGTLHDVIAILCELSRMFDIDWEIGHDYGFLGHIREGVVEDAVTEFINVLDIIPEAIAESHAEELNTDDHDDEADDYPNNILPFPGR